MKISDAIELGSVLRPQTFGPYSDCHGTCAMGAALEAVGKLAKGTDTNTRRVKKIWPWLSWEFRGLPRCPCCGITRMFSTVFSLIVHLNDCHHLPRPVIAAVISKLEIRASAQIDLLDTASRGEKLRELEAHLPVSSKRKPRPVNKEEAGVL